MELSLEDLASNLHSQQNDFRESEELGKSLKEIHRAYKKNVKQLGKDLNRMEFRVTQIRDTRERISIKHIKGLDYVEREFNRIMPNSLTETQLQKNFHNRNNH